MATLGCGKRPKGGGEAGGSTPANIDGTYLMIAANEMGELNFPDDLAKRSEKRRTWVFANNTLTTAAGTGTLVQPFKLDPSQSPGHIDIISAGGKKG
jgi:uncharacterized protein (TIGR03067 family)